MVGSKVALQNGEYKKKKESQHFGTTIPFKRRKCYSRGPFVIGPRRPALRLIRWLDGNFVKGTGCFLCWLNISV